MILYGASGHAKVVSDAITDSNEKIIHLFDDNIAVKSFYNISVTPYQKNIYPKELLIITIGNNQHRKNIVQTVMHQFGKIVHFSAIISSKVKIGEGSVVLQNATIQVETNIRDHCIINTACSIDHECEIDNFVHISPHATLCGNVKVGEGTHIGAGAIILPDIKIGKWSVVGAGSVIIGDVPDNIVIVGNPGRVIRDNLLI